MAELEKRETALAPRDWFSHWLDEWSFPRSPDLWHTQPFEAVPLPAGATAQDVEATYKDGILEVRIPVDQRKAEGRKIPIQRELTSISLSRGANVKFHRSRNAEPAGVSSRRWWRRGTRGQVPTQQLDVEPAHDQPWVPRSSFADRIRRSPRQ